MGCEVMCGVQQGTNLNHSTCGVCEVTCGVCEVTCGVYEVTCGLWYWCL